MFAPKAKRNLLRIIPFGLIWLVFSIVYTLLERGLLGKLTYYPATGNPYDFSRVIFITPVSALITGLFVGALEIYYFSKLFLKKTFTQKIIYKSFIYLAIILAFMVIVTVTGNVLQLSKSVFDKVVWDNFFAFLFNYAFVSVCIYIASIIVVTQFYTEVSENMGHEVLTNFFTGKYHKPTEEERIYMFLDMRSSTTIAEKLGHVKYFEMLREYYADLSPSIINHSGEVYQYVGDEIVVSWKIGNGIKRNNCIHCFFNMKASLQTEKEKYHTRFGLLPEFKAGFHVGKVTTGEIGVIKKEIIFTGDVLNTTARIQSLCNSYGVDIIVSDHLREKLNPDPNFIVTSLGENELKGRDEKIELFTIEFAQ